MPCPGDRVQIWGLGRGGIGYKEVDLYPTSSSAHGTYTLPHPVLTSGGGHRNQPSKTISLRLGKVQINLKYIYICNFPHVVALFADFMTEK